MINIFKNTQKSTNGITLIALVVTIIVLLILAGISISMLSGNNGILQKATTAKESTDSLQIQERINLAYHSSLVDGQGKVTEQSLEDEIKKEFNKTILDKGWLDKTSKAGKWIVTIDNVSLEIPTGEDSDNNATIMVGTTNIKDVSNLSTLYGQETDYTSVNGVKWQLFYDDNSYIYLIASDYVPVSTLGNELNKESGDSTQKYKAWFATHEWVEAYNSYAYAGPIIENSPWSNGTTSVTITQNELTNKYLKWVNGKTSNNPNMKAVAYMMDTSKWSNFAGEIEGAFAIGGPTLEMFVLSWNAYPDHAGEVNQLGTYGTVDSTNSNSYGYMVKKGTGNWTNYGKSNDLGNTTNMWCIHESDKALGMWIASPSSGFDDYVRIVDCGGYFSNYDQVNGNLNGFRPLVVIPKSSLK